MESIQIGAKKSPIVISFKEFKGSPLIDIRKFFLDKSDEELKPTKKGIALKRNNFILLIDAINESQAEILEWLEDGDNKSLNNARNTLSKRVEALEDARRQPQEHQCASESWKAPNFFEIESLGGIDKVLFNSNHELIEFLQDEMVSDTTSPPSFKEMLSKILLSYNKAKKILDDGGEYTGSELFKYLEYEWGLILKNYIKKS